MDEKLNQVSGSVIGAAFEVSNCLGAGFLEKVYERSLVIELKHRGMPAISQKQLPVFYKNELVGEYVADIVVEDLLLVEVKCCAGFVPEHTAQCLNYLKATGMRLGLLLNFQKPRVEIKRVAL